ncbi:hypothetical protein SLE2022_309440 [Rubroshorea leprosula]
MAKQSSTRKYRNGQALSEVELDTALLLTELCRGVRHGDRPAGSSVKRKGEERNDDDPSSNGGVESSASTPTTTLAKGIFLDNEDDDEDEDENDFHLRPRKRRFRSIDDIYRSTKPQDNYNPK